MPPPRTPVSVPTPAAATHAHTSDPANRALAASLGLPPECALPPLTLLWLAARLERDPEAVATQKRKAARRAVEYAAREERKARVAAGEEEAAVRKEQREAERMTRQLAREHEQEARRLRVADRNHAWFRYFNPLYTPVCVDEDENGDKEGDGEQEEEEDEDWEREEAEDDDDRDERFQHEITVEPFIDKDKVPPVTLRNVRILLKILWLLRPRLARLAWQNPRLVACVLLLLVKTAASGLLPVVTLHYSTKLIELAVGANATGHVSWRLPMLYFTATIMSSLGERCLSVLFGSVQQTLVDSIKHTAEHWFLSSTLDLVMESSPNGIQQSLAFAAGILAAANKCMDEDGRQLYLAVPRMVQHFSHSLSGIIGMVSQFTVFIELLYQDAKSIGVRGFMTKSNAFTFALSVFGPVVGYYASTYFNKIYNGTELLGRYWRKKRTVQFLLDEPEGRNELVVFGLKQWTLDLWKEVKVEEDKFSDAVTESFLVRQAHIILSGVEEMLKNLFYVLLATGVIHTSHSFGNIAKHQSLGQTLFRTAGGLRTSLVGSFHTFYLLAAVIAVSEEPISTLSGPKLDYEDYRPGSGMRIEARNLTFAYGRGQLPVLNGINLIVEPGETLAVVGLNGSGKTTLAKTLLGLHKHKGTLLVNGHNIADYDRQTLYRRTSCLFQNFKKYGLQLSTNIGLGDTTRMHDYDALNLAAQRGGAEKIRDELGWNAWMSARTKDEMTQKRQSNNGKVKKIKAGRKAKTPTGLSGRGHGADKVAAPTATATVTMIGEKDANADKSTPVGDKAAPPKAQQHETTNGHAAKLNGNAKANVSRAPQDDTDSERDDNSRDPTQRRTRLKIRDVSGGQWQSIALSRAFMRADSSDLIIFDEPSASLDALAEAELFNRIHSLGAGTGATTIFISHKLSTVRRAHKIAFMELGRIVEYGTHEELMALEGKYFACFDQQRRGFL